MRSVGLAAAAAPATDPRLAMNVLAPLIAVLSSASAADELPPLAIVWAVLAALPVMVSTVALPAVAASRALRLAASCASVVSAAAICAASPRFFVDTFAPASDAPSIWLMRERLPDAASPFNACDIVVARLLADVWAPEIAPSSPGSAPLLVHEPEIASDACAAALDRLDAAAWADVSVSLSC